MTHASWSDAMPEIYDRDLVPVIFAGWGDLLAERCAALRPARILELAAGTGAVTERIFAAAPNAAVTATDLNQAMVDWGSRRVPAANWQLADAQQLPFGDAMFDLVVCQFGVMFFPDKPGAFAESARVLADGGHLLFAVWDRIEYSTYATAVIDIVQAMFPDDPPHFLVDTPHGYHDVHRIKQDLVAGGMQMTNAEPLVLPSRARSTDAVTNGYCLGTPLRFELAARGQLEDLVADIQHRMRDRFGEGPLEGEMAAIVVTAQKDAISESV
jgi:SAM-dependent methyltransferase